MKKKIVREDRFSDRIGALNDPDVDFDLKTHNDNVLRGRENDRRLRVKANLKNIAFQLQKYETDMKEAMMLNARILRSLSRMDKNAAELADSQAVMDALGDFPGRVMEDYWADYVLTADDAGVSGYEPPADFGFIYSDRLKETELEDAIIMIPEDGKKHPGYLGLGTMDDDMEALAWVYVFDNTGAGKFGEKYAVGQRLIDLVDPNLCNSKIVPDLDDVHAQAGLMLAKIKKFLDDYYSYSGSVVDYILKFAKYAKSHALAEGRFGSLADKLDGVVDEGRFADLKKRIPQTLSESRKVTLTVGQLKKLVCEARAEILNRKKKNNKR